MKISTPRSLWLLLFVMIAAAVACSNPSDDTGSITPDETATTVSGTAETNPTRVTGRPDPTATPSGNIGNPLSTATYALPTSQPVALSRPQLPTRPVNFSVRVPGNTPPGEDVYVMLHAADVQSRTHHILLQQAGPGVYSGVIELPEGAMVRYAYDRWDGEGCCATHNITRETLFTGQYIGYRLLIAGSDLQAVTDTVPQWNDLQHDFTETEITGRITDAETGEPLMDVEVTVAGVHVASRYDGTFTVPGIVPGTHRLVAYTVKGDYSAVQQEFEVGNNGLSGLEIKMQKAEMVPVEFSVSLPTNTPADAGVFIAGNLWQLGARPSYPTNEPAVPSGVSMPEMVRDGDMARYRVELPVGAYVEYFYTLGSDVSAEGASHNRMFRSFIVDAGENTRNDSVEYWGNDGWPLVTLRVTVPSNTPDGVPIYLRDGPTYRMHRTGEFEYVTVVGSHPPGATYGYSISLGDDHNGRDGSPDLDSDGRRSVVFPEADAEVLVDVQKWENLPDPTARAANGSLTVKFRLSVPPETPKGSTIILTGDRPAVGSEGTVMTQVPGNPWFYEADINFGHDGLLRYRYTVSESGFASDELSVETDYHGQEVNDYVVSWEGAPAPREGWISGIYTPDFWSEAFLPTSNSAFPSAVEANGEWVAISSVWSFGEIQPAPYLESRPVRIWTVLTPIEDIRAQAAIARENGLKVFLAPQMNPEVHPGWQQETVDAGSIEWWEQWLEQAEAQWMWNAVVAEEIEAEMLLLPGYVFHVFPPPGFFHDAGYVAEFDLKVQAMIRKVREVYSGKILMSGSQADYDFPALADYVGVTTYDLGVPELPADATFEQLEADYAAKFEEKVDSRWERWGKPVLFYTIHTPAKAQEGDPYGQIFQANAYEAMFQQIAERPYIIGSFTWAYDMVGAWQFISDGVRDRAGEAVMAKWYARLAGE